MSVAKTKKKKRLRLNLDKFQWFKRLGYKPNADQAKIHKSNARFKVVHGGEGSGKSMTTGRDVEPDLMQPGYRVWIVGPTLAVCQGVFDWIWNDMVESLDILPGESLNLETTRAVRREDAHQFYIRFAWGATVECKTAKELASIRALSVDCIIITEAGDVPDDAFGEFALGRLREMESRCIIEGCPVWAVGWFSEAADRGRSKRHPHWQAFNLDAEKVQSKEVIAEKRRVYDALTFKRKVKGLFVANSGLVFMPELDPDHNVIPWKYRPDWLTWLAIDFGYNCPWLGWVQSNSANPEDPKFKAVLFDEFAEDCVSIKRLIAAMFMKPYALNGIFCDPAGDGTDSTGWSDYKRIVKEIEAKRNRQIAAGEKVTFIPAPRYTHKPKWTHIPVGCAGLRGLLCAEDGTRRLFIAKHLANNRNYRGFWMAAHKYSYRGGAKPDMPKEDGLYDHPPDGMRYWWINLMDMIEMSTSAVRAVSTQSAFGAKRSGRHFSGPRRRFGPRRRSLVHV